MGFNHRKDWFDQWIVDLWVCLKLDVHPKYGYLMENIGFGDTFIKKSLVLLGLYHWFSWAAFKWFFNGNPQLNILISSQETDAQLISLSGPLTVQLDLTGVISKFDSLCFHHCNIISPLQWVGDTLQFWDIPIQLVQLIQLQLFHTKHCCVTHILHPMFSNIF